MSAAIARSASASTWNGSSCDSWVRGVGARSQGRAAPPGAGEQQVRPQRAHERAEAHVVLVALGSSRVDDDHPARRRRPASRMPPSWATSSVSPVLWANASPGSSPRESLMFHHERRRIALQRGRFGDAVLRRSRRADRPPRGPGCCCGRSPRDPRSAAARPRACGGRSVRASPSAWTSAVARSRPSTSKSTLVATLSERCSIRSTSSPDRRRVARLQRRGRVVEGHVRRVDRDGGRPSAAGRRRSPRPAATARGSLIMLAG